MILHYLLCFFAIITISNGRTVYKNSSDCPGNLKWNSSGITIMGSDMLKFPAALFIEPKTQILYVTDMSYNYVLKRYSDGKVQIAAGQEDHSSGSTSDKLDGPRSVYADENENVYIADWSNQRIQLWTKDAKSGSTVAGNGTRGNALNEFSYPSDIILDSHKNIIAADFHNQRIMQWSPTYNPKTTSGTVVAGGHGSGLSPTQLDGPISLYYDELANTFYISNEEAHTIIQWNRDGYGDKIIYAGIPGRPGSSSVQLQSPQGITLDKYGNLYITDSDNHRIQMFCPNSVFGITIAGTGEQGTGANELYFPRDVALDADLNLYVTDTYNQRIQKFERIQ